MKLITWLLTALVLCSLTACGGGEDVPEPTPVVTVTPAPTPVPTPEPEPADTDLVPIRKYIPDIQVDLRYATTRNFTGKVIYDFDEPYLRYGTVKKLMGVQETLRAQGYGLLIWDGWRPMSAQFKLWEVVPDPVYVANPTTGYSSHSCGDTVDLTLIALDGRTVEMPSEFDEFAAIADRDYSDVSETARANALFLQTTMENAGFTGYFGEWWHFSDNDDYSIEDVRDLEVPHGN